MEITAKCVYDLKAITALHRLQMFKKANPKKSMISWMIVAGIILAALILEIIFLDADMYMLLFVLIVAGLLLCYTYFVLPRVMYNAQGNLKNAENIYVFGENAVHIVSKSAQYNGEAQVEYGLFLKVYETSEYFFLFQTKNQAFAVDKSTIQGGTAEDIRNRLNGTAKKYILCKY